ncbi:MAG: hypothetical protein ACE37H_15005 [Phycisphaeraceae bacterium]
MRLVSQAASQAIVLTTIVLLSYGCSSTTNHDTETIPPDFSLVVNIQLPNKNWNRIPEGATVIVEPNGVLRAATGPGCTLKTYPEPTMKLTISQMHDIYRLAQKLEYNSTTSALVSDESKKFWVRVIQTCHGESKRADVSTEVIDNHVQVPPESEVQDAVELFIYLSKLCNLYEQQPDTGKN